MHSLLAEAEPTRDRGSSSEKMYFRRWEKKAAQLHPEKGVRIRKKISPADTKVRGGEGGGALGTAAKRPCSPW